MDKIFSYIFKSNKCKYKKRARSTVITRSLRLPDKMDQFSQMWFMLQGMSKQSIRKYGIYNKSIDGVRLFNQFPWLNPYE